MTTDQIKDYWDVRARLEPERATTNDVWLRDLEARTLISAIKRCVRIPRFICDAGCGDGKTTLKLAKAFPETHVVGFDYSEAMIELAMANQNRLGIRNCKFHKSDISEQQPENRYDVVTTSRVLINIPTHEEQFHALKRLLSMGRFFVGIENFVEEQINFELMREQAGLTRILTHGHNIYIEQSELEQFFTELGVQSYRISSFANAYYYATRIVYAKSCGDTKPDYLNAIHETAVTLPEIPTPAIAPMKLIEVVN